MPPESGCSKNQVKRWKRPANKTHLNKCVKNMPTPEARRILITVKAYPNPSRKYGETVCCAGIDIDTLQWVRLYPIPYRDLDKSQKFRKYTVIKVRCWKAEDDHRLESYKINSDSIETLDWLDTKRKWAARKKIVLPTRSPSFCQVFKTREHKSLAMFNPCDVDFYWKKATSESEAKREACYAQLSFFDRKKSTIEKIPFDFYYHFRCSGSSDCQGHDLPIVDWEIGQAYRDWRSRYKSQAQLLEKIKERWLDRMCSKQNDIYFYVGNMKRFHANFLVLGVFYPKK
jgi:hypothetical protein